MDYSNIVSQELGLTENRAYRLNNINAYRADAYNIQSLGVEFGIDTMIDYYHSICTLYYLCKTIIVSDVMITSHMHHVHQTPHKSRGVTPTFSLSRYSSQSCSCQSFLKRVMSK